MSSCSVRIRWICTTPLDILPERDRTCITLRFFEELPFADIARILGEPETTVKTRVYRALRKLRAYLEEGDQK